MSGRQNFFDRYLTADLDNWLPSLMWMLMLIRLIAVFIFVVNFGLRAADFDQEVLKEMEQWEVPGLALAIIKDDAIVYKKGYGVLKIGEKTPVTEKTLFAIGSCTKAFTATALGMLIDEQKAAWDDPVAKHLQGFQLSDPYLTREVSLRDLLAHRCSLDTADILWYRMGVSSKSLLEKIRYLQPNGAFRSHYTYHNLMYMVAGEVVAAVAGKPGAHSLKRRYLSLWG